MSRHCPPTLVADMAQLVHRQLRFGGELQVIGDAGGPPARQVIGPAPGMYTSKSARACACAVTQAEKTVVTKFSAWPVHTACCGAAHAVASPCLSFAVSSIAIPGPIRSPSAPGTHAAAVLLRRHPPWGSPDLRICPRRAIGHVLNAGYRGRVVVVLFHRGLPNPRNESEASSASSQQANAWKRRDKRVRMFQRPLAYRGWPDHPPIEKGIDVQIACDMIQAAMANVFAALILFSSDTDLLPVVEVAGTTGTPVEVACWDGAKVLDGSRAHHLDAADWRKVTRDWTGRV